jgi:DNA-binding transcriptional MerR regulator
MATKPRGSLDAGFDLDKPLYTISVASEILETHPRTLMLYEDVGLLQVIQHLTREKGVNLAGVRHILSLFEVVAGHHLQPPPDLQEVFERYQEIL